MICSPFDLRDYYFEELADESRREVEAHLTTCQGCQEELDRLRATESALLSLRDEEIPQRIGFVSDKIFEPSRVRRWWAAFWGSAARLGFASAAMLSVAILVAALHRPVPNPQPPTPNPQIDMAQVDHRVDEAVRKVVAEVETRQAKKTAELLAVAERRHLLELKSIQLAVEENLEMMNKRLNVFRRAALDLGDLK